MHDPDSTDNAKKEKQAVIFEAACQVIREKGFHQARITDIAHQAGISYGLVYHYFGSKDHLYDAIIEEWWNGIFSVIDRWSAQPATVRQKLFALADHFLDLYEQRPNLVHIFINEISRSSSKFTPARLAFFKTFFDKTEEIVASAQETGELRTDIKARYLTYIFFGALEGFLSALVLEDVPIRSPELKERISSALLDVFFQGAEASDK